ncbi:hypothetical protein DICVIV_07421 [Dictyocaulus viviparus]|uniref:Uncharacterized protein n=1 Tax=Dictyocaulus viviparus TaxID=29172 RepID=A0A0D8XRU1_DICVI|nr:hypothetical protein DICVIV_07421 [Dictyocaulus viviparus]
MLHVVLISVPTSLFRNLSNSHPFEYYLHTSLDKLKHVSRKYSEGHLQHGSKMLLNIQPQPHRYNDYLHPKYSLPPVKLDIGDIKWEYEKLLKTPGKAVRTNLCSVPQELASTSCPEL